MYLLLFLMFTFQFVLSVRTQKQRQRLQSIPKTIPNSHHLQIDIFVNPEMQYFKILTENNCRGRWLSQAAASFVVCVRTVGRQWSWEPLEPNLPGHEIPYLCWPRGKMKTGTQHKLSSQRLRCGHSFAPRAQESVRCLSLVKTSPIQHKQHGPAVISPTVTRTKPETRQRHGFWKP